MIDCVSQWQNPKKSARPRVALPANSPWLDVDQAAERLKVSEATVYRRLRSGVLAGLAAVAAGLVTRDLRRRRGPDRPTTSWNHKFPADPYVTREASSR